LLARGQRGAQSIAKPSLDYGAPELCRWRVEGDEQLAQHDGASTHRVELKENVFGRFVGRLGPFDLASISPWPRA
jgi:hypothetical protein